MGQHVSVCHSNDELVNTLIKQRVIRTKNVERVLRCVDRGFYYPSEHKSDAYRDSAFVYGKIHLSAPCIYAKALECLCLNPGDKFLNIGSGIGYLSTLAGLLIGAGGVNHGIEVQQTLIDYGYHKMEEFKLSAAAIDYYEFCEPIFIHGNACELLPTGYYDRVYCGAGVPTEEYEFMKSLINIGGILVMPMDGSLVRIMRTGDRSWRTMNVLDVSFMNLIIPDRCSLNTVKFPPAESLSLQELCRSNIRLLIRENTKDKCPNLAIRTKCPDRSHYRCDEDMVLYTNEVIPDIDDPLSAFSRMQYGVTGEELASLRNIVQTFVGLDDVMSDDDDDLDDLDNDNDVHNDDNDVNNDDNENELEQDDQEADESPTEETIKRKLPETGSAEQKKPISKENSKRMKMNSSTLSSASAPSTSSHSNSDLWETVSTAGTSRSSVIHNDDSESWISSVEDNLDENNGSDDDDSDDEEETDIVLRACSHILFDQFSDEDDINSVGVDSDTDSEASRNAIMFSFKTERKENELSKKIKSQIDSLPLPGPLKRFLNYNRVD